MPVIQRRRDRRIVSPLSEEGCESFKRTFNYNTNGLRKHRTPLPGNDSV
jgi:hypothetical protein